MTLHPWSLRVLSFAAIAPLILTATVVPGSTAATANSTGEIDPNAVESAPISAPNNPNSLSYSFTTRWNFATNSGQSLGVTMPMSTNGMVNIVGIDGDVNRRGDKDRSSNVLAREIFNDGLERAGESTLTMLDSRQVLIGTTRGELVNVNPNNLRTTRIDVPSGTASSILNMYDAGQDVILATRSADYRNASNRGSGEVLKLKYVCTYTKCTNEETWTRYGAPVNGNTYVYGASSWNGVVFAGSGDQRAVLSAYEDGQWREVVTVDPKGTGKAERFVQARVVGDYLYASYQGTNEPEVGTHVYRIGKDEAGKVTLDQIRLLKGMAWITAPVAPGMGYSASSAIYRGANDSLMILDPTVGPNGKETPWGYYPAKNMPDEVGLGALPTSSCWIQADRDVTPNRTCATWYPGGSDIVLTAPGQEGKNYETVKRIAAVSPSGEVIIDSGRRAIGRLAVGPGDSGIFASTPYFGHFMRQIDPATGSTKDLPIRSWRDRLGGTPQIESIGAVGDQLLTGLYPQGGTISQIDPSKPVTCEYSIDRAADDCNPTITTNDRIIDNGQARPVTIADLGEGKAAIGSYGFRNNITGAVTFYDTKNKKITSRMSLQDSNGIKLSQMGVSVIANRDVTATGGWIYFGTNAAPPDNPSTEPAAAVVRYNINTKETQAIEVPRKLVSDLAFGADGRLYAMVGYSFLTIDPGLNGGSFTIVDQTNIGTRWAAPGGSMAPLSDGTFAVVAGSGDYYDGPLYLMDPRGAGKPKATPLGESAYRVVVVDAPSGQGSRWFFNRGPGIYYQDQPKVAGPLR